MFKLNYLKIYESKTPKQKNVILLFGRFDNKLSIFEKLAKILKGSKEYVIWISGNLKVLIIFHR